MGLLKSCSLGARQVSDERVHVIGTQNAMIVVVRGVSLERGDHKDIEFSVVSQHLELEVDAAP